MATQSSAPDGPAPTYAQVDIKKLAFKDPMARSGGKPGFHLYIDKDANCRDNLKFQTPRSRTPFGLNDDSTFADAQPAAASYKTSAMIALEDEVFLRKMRDLDEMTLNAAITNKAAWFPGPKPKADDWIAQRFFPCVKTDPAGQYVPKIKIKIMKEGRDATKIYLMRSKGDKKVIREADLSVIKANCYVTAILSIAGAWIGAAGFGVDIRAEQIIVEEPAPTRSYTQFQIPGLVYDNENKDADGGTEWDAEGGADDIAASVSNAEETKEEDAILSIEDPPAKKMKSAP